MSETAIVDIPKTRAHLIGSYVDNMYEFMQVEFPNAPRKDLYEFIRTETNDWCKGLYERLAKAKKNGEDLTIPRPREEMLWPTMKMIKHIDRQDIGNKQHSYGNITYYEDEDLLATVTDYRDKIISPFGTFYETVNNKPSFLKGMVDVKGKQRKTEKKAMLQAKKEGNRTKETFHNNNQATIKINMNSLIGAMGSGFNFLSSIANFNSVTSIARFFIMNAYAHAERFLESNFYFRTEEQLVDFLVNCRKKGPNPDKVLEVCTKMGLKIPTWEECYAFLTKCLHRYMFACDHPMVKKFLSSMHPGEITFIYYMSNMKHLVFENAEYFKPWILNFFSDASIDFSQPCEPSDLYKIDGDLIVVLSTVYNEIMPVNDKGNSISVYDCVDAHPDLARKFVHIGKHMQDELDRIHEVFEIFMNHKVGIGYVGEHKQMFRDTVILSDTDSIVFTTKSWVQWFSGNLKLDKMAFCVNALVVYWLSKANSYILYNVSEAFGALGKDLFTMNMKNEFMMPIEILTSLKKHYVAMLKIQEGVVYSKPRLDIKGVNLRGSNFSKLTLNYVVWFIQTCIDDIYNDGKVSARKKILEVLRFERMVFDTLRDGDTKFLMVDPVKAEEEYSDADRSIYFNYLFWEHVFGERYGNIMVPTKCFVLPLTNVKHPDYWKILEEKYPESLQKLQQFLERYPLKDINRIPINPLTDKIPEELRPITNYKAIIYANAKPLYLILQSFGLSAGNSKKQIALFSDSYGWVTKEEGAKAAEFTQSS